MNLLSGMIFFAAGMILAGMEILLPGFGLPGISAIVSFFLGVYSMIVSLGWNGGILVSFLCLAASGLALFFLARLAVQGKSKGRKIFLSARDLEQKNCVKETAEVGEEGIVIADLHPSGVAEIGGKRVSVVTEGSYIPAGERIVVSSVNGTRVIVRVA